MVDLTAQDQCPSLQQTVRRGKRHLEPVQLQQPSRPAKRRAQPASRRANKKQRVQVQLVDQVTQQPGTLTITACDPVSIINTATRDCLPVSR